MDKCPICGSRDFKKVLASEDKAMQFKSSEIFNLVRCNLCDVNYISPLPEDLHKYYYRGYYTKKNFLTFFVVWLTNLLKKSRLGIKRGNLLDIGCGNGDFLDYMNKKGWDVYGIEPSDEGFEIAIKRLPDRVYKDITKLPKIKFDVVTMWHVLEHVNKPNDLLRKINKILNVNGILYLAIPNIDSFDFKIGYKNWFCLDLPRHVIHYNLKSIRYLLENNGFKIRKTRHFFIGYSPLFLTQTMLNILNVDFNFLTNFLKGRIVKKNNFKLIYNFIITFTLGIIIFLISVPLTYILSLFRFTDYMGVEAVKG